MLAAVPIIQANMPHSKDDAKSGSARSARRATSRRRPHAPVAHGIRSKRRDDRCWQLEAAGQCKNADAPRRPPRLTRRRRAAGLPRPVQVMDSPAGTDETKSVRVFPIAATSPSTSRRLPHLIPSSRRYWFDYKPASTRRNMTKHLTMNDIVQQMICA